MHDNKPGYYDCVLLSRPVRSGRRFAASFPQAVLSAGLQTVLYAEHDRKRVPGDGPGARHSEARYDLPLSANLYASTSVPGPLDNV